jgi:CubicO group peptidase (beta-lactamase class C family)
MQSVEEEVTSLAQRTRFSGIVRVDRGDTTEYAQAFGLADRAHEIANTIDTRFALASGAKGLTALTVVSLVQDGTLDRSTTARTVLGGDLPMIDERGPESYDLAFKMIAGLDRFHLAQAERYMWEPHSHE